MNSIKVRFLEDWMGHGAGLVSYLHAGTALELKSRNQVEFIEEKNIDKPEVNKMVSQPPMNKMIDAPAVKKMIVKKKSAGRPKKNG